MAIQKQPVIILAPTNVPAGRAAVNPVWGPLVDVRAFRGGEWSYRVQNGASAPGVGATIIMQTSPTSDPADCSDYFTIAADTVSGGGINRSIRMGAGVMYARIGAYGNTTNDVTISSTLQAEVG